MASSTKAAPKTAAKAKEKPTEEEIAALRAARASKKAALQAQAEEAAAQARAEAQERAARGDVPLDEKTGRPLYVGRRWIPVRDDAIEGRTDDGHGRQKVRIVSWNILAQGLIERRLFPGSDALKWRDRQPGLAAELVGHAYDVGCFQEVDRFDVLSQTLRDHGYAYEYQRGYRAKKHGLAIVWRTEPRPGQGTPVFEPEPAARALLYLDHAAVDPVARPSPSGWIRTACTRETRNIALVVAIRFKKPATEDGQSSAGRSGGRGLIVATTHTFWHPRHGAERARQIGILLRHLDAFRRRPGAEWHSWDLVLAGDFNDQPDSATYELATGRGALREVAIGEVAESMVVHSSVDERINARGEEERRRLPRGLVDITSPLGAVDGVGVELPGTAPVGRAAQAEVSNGQAVTSDSSKTPTAGTEPVAQEEDEAEEEGEPEAEAEAEAADEEAEGEEHEDRILKNCRPARASDGLLTLPELRQLYDLGSSPPSGEEGVGYDAGVEPDPRVGFLAGQSVERGGREGREGGGGGGAALRSAYGTFYHRLARLSPAPIKDSTTTTTTSPSQPDQAPDPTPEEEEHQDPAHDNYFGSPTRGRERWNDPTWIEGETTSAHAGDGHEPMWTLFSPLFSLTLDYIFVFPRLGEGEGQGQGAVGGDRGGERKGAGTGERYPPITALLPTHRTEVLKPGTPRRFVNASDHILLGAEVVL